jgi:hypothetical protein
MIHREHWMNRRDVGQGQAIVFVKDDKPDAGTMDLFEIHISNI